MKLKLFACLLSLSLPFFSAQANSLLNADDYAFDLARLNKTLNAHPPDLVQGNILFINLNLNPRERIAVQNFADATHQNVVSFPDDQLMVELRPVYLQYAKTGDRIFQLGGLITALQTQIDSLKHKRTKEWQKLMTLKLQAMTDEMNLESDHLQNGIKETAHVTALHHYGQTETGADHAAQATLVYETALTQLITKVKSENLHFQTVVISGHHGQYFFGDLTLAFNETVERSDPTYFSLYEHLKPLLSEVKSIALWGCDTVSLYSAEEWLNLSPGYQTMIGYSDSAPKGSRDSSSLFLEKGLLAGPGLFSSPNQQELKNQMEAIPGVANSAAAMVVRSPSIGDLMISATIGVKHGVLVLSRKVEDLSKQLQCAALQPQIADTIIGIRPYLAGMQELPLDDALSPVKRAYFFLHHNEQCFKQTLQTISSVYQVGLLRFFNTDVKFNIANALESKIGESRVELANPELAALKTMDFQQILIQKNRTEIIAAITAASEMASHLHAPATLTLLKSLQRLVVDLDDSCMPFDRWHEKSALPLKFSCDLNS